MGYHYVREMKTFLFQGQEDALMLTARAVATVLNDREELFSPETGVPELLGDSRNLLARPMDEYLRMDGDDNDWGGLIDQAQTYSASSNPQSLSFDHALGYKGRYLYALFQVDDNRRVYRHRTMRRLDNSDHIRLMIEDPYRQIRRYVLTTREPGSMSVYLMKPDWIYPETGEAERNIKAVLRETNSGYNVEVRIPRVMISSNTGVAFTIADVDDDDAREVSELVSTTPEASKTGLGRVLLHSPEIAQILSGLEQPFARIWVLDSQQRVRAVVGSLTNELAVNRSRLRKFSFRRWLATRLDKVYAKVWESPATEFEDISTDVSHRSDEVLQDVLGGDPRTQRRPSLDKRAEILMAAYPIWLADDVMGAVVVEQSSNEVLALQHEAIQSVTTVTLAVFLFVTLAMLVFASRITLRIGRLRNLTERAITPEGRVRINRIPADSRAGDEIGDLSRGISSMLRRLSQYTRYLEAMPDTLAHELSNPLNVVNSSLENLETDIPGTHDNKYLIRAKSGIKRLRSILTNLTEAANLEDAMHSEDLEVFDMVKLIFSVVDGYRITHKNREFKVDVLSHPLPMRGSPDHIAQLLDKLADNAVQFGKPDTAIIIRIDRLLDDARISVLNEGSRLPDDTMRDRLFDPMISVGTKNANQPHLGLGLFVARLITEFHGGSVWADNRQDVEGVVVTVSLPLSQN